MYATHDGARTWTPVRLATRDRPLLVSAAGGAAYALTGCPDRGADCPRAALWTIDPSGFRAPETFTSLPMRTASGSTALAAYGNQVWVLLGLLARGDPQVTFVSAAVGYLVGRYSGTLDRTTDGGRTWQPIPSP